MKTMKICLLVSLLSVSLQTYAGNTLPMPEIKKINSRVYALLGPTGLPDKNNNGYMVNSTVIIGDKGVILIDTGFTDEIGRHIKQIIKGLSDKPVTHIINTHHHGDHTLGNSEFKGAEIISAEKCKEWLSKTGYEWIGTIEAMTGRKFPNTKPVLANKVYAENTRTNISLQGVAMTLWVPKGSHTAGDMMVYLPQDNILVTGDIVVNTMIPSLRDAYVKNLIDTLDQVANMQVATIVPGHGSLMKTVDVKQLHELIKGLYKKVSDGYEQGLMDSEIRKTMDLSVWKKYKAFDDLMGANINRTYLEVEKASF